MPRILSHSALGLGLGFCCLLVSPGGAPRLSATLQIIRFSYPMNFTTILKTFTQHQQKRSLGPFSSDTLFVCIFGIGVTICLFFIWRECVGMYMLVCVWVGVGVCVKYKYYMYCICRRRAAALFMRVSPFYVYLNFLVGAHRGRQGGRAKRADSKKCKRRHNNAQ